MKTITSVLLTMFLWSCEGASVKLNLEDCNNQNCLLSGFNSSFSNIKFTEDQEKIQFDSIAIKTPNFKDEFYDNEKVSSFLYFSLINKETQLDIAISKTGSQHFHEIYFITKAEGEEYIEEGKFISGDFSFLNQCGFKIYEDSLNSDKYSWQSNFFDARLLGKWQAAESELSLKVKKDSIWIDNNRFNYEKDGNKIINDKLGLLFNIIAIGNDKILIFYNNKIIELGNVIYD